jgi:Na+(H+)/acetate symporter ActP
MKKNMGTLDRIIRVLLAIVVLILYLAGSISGVAAIILGIFAVVFVITSAIGYCPLYAPLKISTVGKSKQS